MKQKDLKRFVKILREKRLSIMDDLGLLESQSMNTTSADSSGDNIYSDHMPDLGSAAIEREKAFMFASRDGVYLGQLDAALKRIEDGSFGNCRVCCDEIPNARMEAVPTTTLCISCKESSQRNGRPHLRRCGCIQRTSGQQGTLPPFCAGNSSLVQRCTP